MQSLRANHIRHKMAREFSCNHRYTCMHFTFFGLAKTWFYWPVPFERAADGNPQTYFFLGRNNNIRTIYLYMLRNTQCSL
jgi:hypothetical protein